MKKLITALALLAGCLDVPASNTPPDPEPTYGPCGAPPAHPGYTIAYEGDHVSMPRESWKLLSAWMDAEIVWRDCVAGEDR